VLDVRARLPKLRRIFVFDTDGLARFADAQVLSFAALRELGRQRSATHTDEFERRVASREPRDVAVLIYTSVRPASPRARC